jgi:thiosulfate dehydrogenase (quinone) large subunit
MNNFQKKSLFLLRIGLGWMFLYAGISHLKDSNFAQEVGGYLAGAKTFAGFYHWLASPALLPVTAFMNEWGLALVGIALILGLFTRIASYGGMLMMILYYLVILQFPYPNAHAYIVDEHVVYILGLFVLATFRAGQAYGLDKWCANLPICAKFPKLRAWLG